MSEGPNEEAVKLQVIRSDDEKVNPGPIFHLAPPLDSDVFTNVPRACDGACSFCCMCCLCCLLGLIIPLAILLPLYFAYNEVGLLIALCILCGLGCLVCCFSSRALCGGIFCQPPIPPECLPFQNAAGKVQTRVPKALYVIVNPHSGLKRSTTLLNEIVLPLWKKAGIEVTVLETTSRGHAVELARTVELKNVDGLCVLGGDGSFHEVVNGFLQRPEPRPDVVLGLIPGGSGNSLMKDLGTWDVEVAARRIAEGMNVPMDANLVLLSDNRIFSVNEVSWGLVGDVGVVSEGWRWLGPSRYDLCALWGLCKSQRRRCELSIDTREKISGEMNSVFFNNTQHFGKGLRAAPGAVLDDGAMDLCYMPNISRGEKLVIFLQLPEGRHGAGVETLFKAKKVKMDCEEGAGVLNIDGENYPFSGAFTVEAVPGVFRIFVGKENVKV